MENKSHSCTLSQLASLGALQTTVLEFDPGVIGMAKKGAPERSRRPCNSVSEFGNTPSMSGSKHSS